MGPKQAISTGFRKAVVFSGRASRAEFWWFAPVASVVPIFVALYFDWRVSLNWGIGQLFIVMMASLPLISAMSRRLQDTGEEGYQAIFPFMPIILCWLGYQLFLGFSLLVGGPILWLILAFLTLLPAYVASLIVSVMVTSSIIGMMLVASDSGENRFGAPSRALPS